MGLNLRIGKLANVLPFPDEVEHIQWHREVFESINSAIVASGGSRYAEPETLKQAQFWSCEMFGYFGLHSLRRLAAHLAYGKPLPPPSDQKAHEDPVLKRYYNTYINPKTGKPQGPSFWLRKLPSLRFKHLVIHGDAQGFYVPVPLADVLYVDETLVPGGYIGSSYALREECEELRKALEIPPSLRLNSRTLTNRLKNFKAPATSNWERYPIEVYSCLALIEGATRSIKAKSALAFA